MQDLNNINDIDSINRWLDRVELVAAGLYGIGARPASPQTWREISEIDVALQSLKGQILDAQYDATCARLANLKSRISLFNPYNHMELLIQAGLKIAQRVSELLRQVLG